VLPVSPGATIPWETATAFKTLTSVSNGVQYAPVDGDVGEGTLNLYEPRFLDFLKFTEVTGDSKDTYGESEEASNPKIRVRSYVSNDQPEQFASEFAMNQNVTHNLKSSSQKVSPDTGVMVQYKQESSTHYAIPCQKLGNGTAIMLPLPDLDSVACTQYHFYDIQQSTDINQADYNSLFQFVHTGNDKVHTTTVLFLCGMIIMAVAFIGLLIFYCTSLRKIQDDDDDNELKQMLK
jgi:hypothetical protein